MGKAHPFLAPLTCFPSQTQSARSVDRKYLALLFPIPSALISPPRSPIWHVRFIVEVPLPLERLFCRQSVSRKCSFHSLPDVYGTHARASSMKMMAPFAA